MLPIQLMYDESWADMLADFRACKKPAKWKYTFVQITGEENKAWWDKGHFYLKTKGTVKMVASVSLMAKVMQHKKLREMSQLDVDPSYYIGRDDEFMDRMVANHTGNHKGRSRKIRVPTRPGQPVRA